ncbi:MAG: hypothetical protein ACTSXQ_02140 [Alphaproteobacteria bacterium]
MTRGNLHPRFPYLSGDHRVILRVLRESGLGGDILDSHESVRMTKVVEHPPSGFLAMTCSFIKVP